MWQIRQLEAFGAVVAQGSITRAASKLHISQPAVSKLVSTLERNCGFKLFFRLGNRLTITSEGELLFAEVQRLIAGAEEIKGKADEIREKRFGTLHVAAFPALASRTLPIIVSKFIQDHPSVKPLLTSRSSQHLVEWVTAQKSDLGVTLLHMNRTGVSFHRLMQVKGLCVLPANHRLRNLKVITAQDLAGEPFIALHTDDRTRHLTDLFFRGWEAQRNIVAQTQMSEAACQMVAAGAGVSIVEPFSTMGFGSDEIIVIPISPVVYFDIWLLYPTYRPISLMARKFSYFLESEIHSILDSRNFDFTPFPLNLPA